MTLHRIGLRIACVVGVLAAGCSDVDSSNLKTSGIVAYLTVTTTGDGNATAVGTFSVDDTALTYVEFKDGDTLTATTGDETKPMTESKLLGIIDYVATFPGKDAEGTSYTLALQRDSDTSAPDSTISIPAPFTVTSPTGSALSYSRANDDIVIQYSGSGHSEPISYDVVGDCLDIANGKTVSGDTGTITIPKGSIALRENATTTTCSATVTIRRTRAGQLDSAYAHGTASGIQARSFAITTTP